MAALLMKDMTYDERMKVYILSELMDIEKFPCRVFCEHHGHEHFMPDLSEFLEPPTTESRDTVFYVTMKVEHLGEWDWLGPFERRKGLVFDLVGLIKQTTPHSIFSFYEQAGPWLQGTTGPIEVPLLDGYVGGGGELVAGAAGGSRPFKMRLELVKKKNAAMHQDEPDIDSIFPWTVLHSTFPESKFGSYIGLGQPKSVLKFADTIEVHHCYETAKAALTTTRAEVQVLKQHEVVTQVARLPQDDGGWSMMAMTDERVWYFQCVRG